MYECAIEIPYKNERQAQIIHDCLTVDGELKPDLLQRKMEVRGNVLFVTFTSRELRCVRVSVSGFYDMLILASRTLEEFDQ